MNPQPSEAETWLYMLFLLPFFLYGVMKGDKKEEEEQRQRGLYKPIKSNAVVYQPQRQSTVTKQLVVLTDPKIVTGTISALRGLGFKGVGPAVKLEAQRVAYTNIADLIRKVLQNGTN